MNILRSIRVKGLADYEPWPELNHSARSIRRLAREAGEARLHLQTAALVMTALAVKAFCQTVGKKVMAETWEEGGSRLPPMQQLVQIGRSVGIDVNYREAPWHAVAQLMGASEALMVAKGGFAVDETFRIDADRDLSFEAHMEVQRHHRSLHDISELERVATAVNSALLEIWDACGGEERALNVLEARQWDVESVRS
ncbi:hypothetical protein [Stenotrophomonas pavanii]|uniref:hypothetical protein n=1 Tax=Stenotrophomonas pavanii TaxID=487698 RepID=UPI0039C5CA83